MGRGEGGTPPLSSDSLVEEGGAEPWGGFGGAAEGDRVPAAAHRPSVAAQRQCCPRSAGTPAAVYAAARCRPQAAFGSGEPH